MDWPYKSHPDLVDAGYRLRERVHCPECGMELLIYSKPYGFPVFLDPGTFALHLEGFQHAAVPDGTVHAPDGKSAAAGDRP